MVYTTLGKSSLSISRIGFGCMSLEQKPLSIYLLEEAVALGINYFDTADLYNNGLNEQIVGKALKPYRDQVIIATKVGNVWRPDGNGWDWNASKHYIIKAVEESLIRLQTDYIDLYQLHGGTINDPIDETIEAFEQLIQQGKIRYYGISSIRPNVIREWVSRSQLTSVMLQYSLLDRRPEESILPLLKERNIGVLARGSVAQGLLINKPAKPYLDYSVAQVNKMAEAVKILTNINCSSVQIAIQAILQNKFVNSAIVGMRNIKQLKEAVQAIEAPIDASGLNELYQILPLNHYKDHR